MIIYNGLYSTTMPVETIGKSFPYKVILSSSLGIVDQIT